MTVRQYKKLFTRFALLFSITFVVVLCFASFRKEVYLKSNYVQTTLKEIQTNSISEQRTTSLSKFNFYNKTAKYDGKVYRFGSGEAEIKIAVVLCGERLNQTVVTLKSAQLFTKQRLHFVLVVDEFNKENIKNKLLEWPPSILDHLSFEIHPIQFPTGSEGEEWRKLFKICACQRLFLPSVLPHIDSLLYVDTDVLFLHPVEDLWHHFYKMNASHIAALCPEHEDFSTGWYNRFARHPFYEPLGVNSGVMLMNLTRMRAFQWEKYLAPIMKEYKLNIVWGDQDIINIIFHFHTEKLYLLPCEWNYRPDHCMYSSVCKTAEKNGVLVIHGNRGVFHNNKQPAFKSIFQSMLQYSLGQDHERFLELAVLSLRKNLDTNCERHLSVILAKMKRS